MTTEREAVDWEVAFRRERRRDAVRVLPVIGWAAGVVLLHRNWVSPDLAPRIALVVGAALGLVVLGLTVGVRSIRTDFYRMQYAIRELVDPGPALRARTDRLAEKRSWRWYRWGIPFWVLYACLRGRWDMPSLAAPGAALLLVSGAAAALSMRRLAAAADRWLESPPGPPREPDPESRRSAQRELTIFLVGAGVLLIALYVVAVLTS
jgi:hypothetical protein